MDLWGRAAGERGGAYKSAYKAAMFQNEIFDYCFCIHCSKLQNRELFQTEI